MQGATGLWETAAMLRCRFFAALFSLDIARVLGSTKARDAVRVCPWCFDGALDRIASRWLYCAASPARGHSLFYKPIET